MYCYVHDRHVLLCTGLTCIAMYRIDMYFYNTCLSCTDSIQLIADHMFTYPPNMDSRDKQSNICIAPALQIILS
jgi:hypothetical protein